MLAAVPDRLDGVFHAAGVAGGGPVHLLARSDWDRVIGINLTGTFLVAKAALARMIEQERVDGERGSNRDRRQRRGPEGTAGGSSYNAAKGGGGSAHQEYCARLRAERHPRDAICPGFIERHGQRSSSACPEWMRSAGLHHHGACTAKARPAKEKSRPWRPSCCRRTPRFVSGQAIAVDGGYTAGRDHGCGATLRLSRLTRLGFIHEPVQFPLTTPSAAIRSTGGAPPRLSGVARERRPVSWPVHGDRPRRPAFLAQNTSTAAPVPALFRFSNGSGDPAQP